MQKNIAILAGGPSSERTVSLNSAKTIAKYLNPDKYNPFVIDLDSTGWHELSSGKKVDLNDFSLSGEGNEKIKFDFAFLIVHGTPVEDGKVAGYLEMKGIPHSGCGILTSALTFSKQKCKNYLRPYGIPMAASMIVTNKVGRSEVENSGIAPPLFVKPNNNGSSYGVSKVKSWDDLEAALDLALQYDHEVMIEKAIVGKEYSCGVFREGNHFHVLPVTEIIPKAEFFTYEAKYLGASEEITPAPIGDVLKDQCQARALLLYQTLGCRGMVRFDFILEEGTFFFLEANTTPGMSEASIIPQQVRAYGWTLDKFLDTIIQDCLSNPV